MDFSDRSVWTLATARDFSDQMRDFSDRDVLLALVAVGLSGTPRYTDIQILRKQKSKVLKIIVDKSRVVWVARGFSARM